MKTIILILMLLLCTQLKAEIFVINTKAITYEQIEFIKFCTTQLQIEDATIIVLPTSKLNIIAYVVKGDAKQYAIYISQHSNYSVHLALAHEIVHIKQSLTDPTIFTEGTAKFVDGEVTYITNRAKQLEFEANNTAYDLYTKWTSSY